MALPAAIAQTAIKTTAGASISAGVWTLVAIVGTTIITTLGLVWVAYIKQWGPWRKAESDARDADFARLRSDITRQDERILKLESLVESAGKVAAAANEHAVRSDAKLQTALTACEVLLSLVEREMPQAKEISLVKRLLAQAAADDLGVGAGMRKLAMMKGAGE